MPTVALDLDGTLAEWGHDGTQVGEWRDGAQEFVRDLFGLQMDGGRFPVQVVVQSCRATWAAGGGWASIAEFLHRGGFQPWLVESGLTVNGVKLDGDAQREVWHELVRFDGEWRCSARMPELGGPPRDARAVGIWHGQGKPIASAYVDDRGVHVPPDRPWGDVLEHVRGLI